MSRLAISSRVPGVVLIATVAIRSGCPIDSLANRVNLNVAWLRGPTIQDPSSVAIFWRTSVPDPLVGAAFASNRSLVSSRFESR